MIRIGYSIIALYMDSLGYVLQCLGFRVWHRESQLPLVWQLSDLRYDSGSSSGAAAAFNPEALYPIS